MLKKLLKLLDSDPLVALFETKLNVTVLDLMKKRQLNRTGRHATENLIEPSKFCLRKIYYQKKNNVSEIHSYETLKRFLQGIVIHNKYQRLFKLAKMLRYKAETTFYSRFLGVTATPDSIINFLNLVYVIEVKSMDPNLFYHVKQPPKLVRLQANIYMYIVGIPRAIILIENKGTQDLKIFFIEIDFDIISRFLRRHFLILRMLDSGKKPKQKCKKITDKLTKTCKFKEECFR